MCVLKALVMDQCVRLESWLLTYIYLFFKRNKLTI